ncbi:uncharacterized protein LOC118816084 [Colossoma macropomum]|uniref:uncharacterized protein LOC118816084 n=1 Tax=Colossoma macropomum TaxID=42526 RepID=UPI0018652998|nr:uncharacterized protein LOC118816084 [Colossoma macropomum]
MSSADAEAEASGLNMQTHLGETDPSNDHRLDVEKTSDEEADWKTIESLMADLLNDVQRSVDHSLAGNEIHKEADEEVKADDLKLMDVQLDETETTVHQALGKDVEMTADPEPIKSWADIVDETERNINQSAEIEDLKKDAPVNETKTDQHQKNTRRGTRGKGRTINYIKDKEERQNEGHEEENSRRTSDRGIRVGAAGQRHQPGYGKTRTQSENVGTCGRAPETVPHQQRRGQRNHWTREHLQKSLQAPPEEKSAPQIDIRKKGEHLRTSRPADNQRDRGAHSVRQRMDESRWRGAAQCWQREHRVQRSDAPQPPSRNGGRVSERGRRGHPAQPAPSRTDRNDRTVRKPHWWQHDDRSVEPDDGQTGERHHHKKYRNENRQWKSGRRTNTSY